MGDRDGEQTIEDQCLTAVLGMAIGHTRRLHARFTSEAPGTNLHEKKLRHATRLETASIKTWPHNMGQNSKIIKVRVVRHSDDEEVEPEEASRSPVAALQTSQQTKLTPPMRGFSRRNFTSRSSIQGRLMSTRTRKPTKKVITGPSRKSRESQYRHRSRHRIQITPHLKPHEKVHSYKTIFLTNLSTRL